MELSSYKNHVADVTTAGTYVIQHEERLLVSKHGFCFVYFYHPCHRGVARRQTRMVPKVAGIIVKPVDFCYLTCMCISGVLHAIYPRYCSAKIIDIIINF